MGRTSAGVPESPRRPLPSGRFPAVHYVLAGRTAVQDAHAAFNLAVRHAAQTGGFLPARVGVYLEELTAALSLMPDPNASPYGSAELPQDAESAPWPQIDETVSSSEAADLLGITARRARQMAPLLGGRLVGNAWRLSRLEVLAERDRRKGVDRHGSTNEP
jgi:hypothetical protein